MKVLAWAFKIQTQTHTNKHTHTRANCESAYREYDICHCVYS